MDPRHEMARLVQQALLEFIRPVQLLTIEADEQSGEVTGRFRSGPLLFDYAIKGEQVRYGPLGGAKGQEKAAGEAARPAAVEQAPERGDSEAPGLEPEDARADAVEEAWRDNWIRRGVRFLAGLWDRPEARIDAYLAAEVRMDAAAGVKRCSTGYQCGSTCIARSKICAVESRNPERLKALQAFAKGQVGAKAQAAARDLPPLTPNPLSPGRDPKAAALATALLKRMDKLEAETTPQMLELASAVGGEMDGLAYRKKGLDSLARKIGDEYKAGKGNFTHEEVANGMSDVVRYTMRFSSETYVAGVEQALDGMEKAGYSVRVKNFWQPNQPYRGINVAVTTKEGDKFELQFHTPESLHTKHATHPLYSQYREERDDAKRRELWNTMVPAQNRLRSPLTPFIGPARQAMKRRLLGIGSLKKFDFQTAAEAGLV